MKNILKIALVVCIILLVYTKSNAQRGDTLISRQRQLKKIAAELNIGEPKAASVYEALQSNHKFFNVIVNDTSLDVGSKFLAIRKLQDEEYTKALKLLTVEERLKLMAYHNKILVRNDSLRRNTEQQLRNPIKGGRFKKDTIIQRMSNPNHQ